MSYPRSSASRCRGSLPACFILAALLFLTFSPRAAHVLAAPVSSGTDEPQQTGAITGRVVDAETRLPLPGANVTIEGTTRGTATDKDGAFTLVRLDPGTVTLQVTFLGYETARQTLTVQDGATAGVRFELRPAAVRGEEVTVLGIRASGQARALSQQKNAANITNVIAADQMGRFPDATAPEALQRVPGIGIQRDQGEGRFVQIRGGAPQFTTVTFNGERIPSPEGDVRQIALDAVPSEILEAIEVSKAITPDMDADAIGGAVNLVTRRAPQQRLLSASISGGTAPVREQGSVKGSAVYGNRTRSGRLGYLVNGTIERRNFGSDNIEPAYDFGDDDVASADDALEEMEVRYYDLMRQRIGGNGVVDYRISDQSSIFVRGIFAQLQDTEQRLRLGNVVEDDELTFEHKNRTEFLRSYSIAAGGEHRLSSGWEFDYQATLSASEEDTPRDNEIAFVQEDVSFAPDISDPDNVRANPDQAALNALDAFEFDAIDRSSSLTENTDYVASVNASRPFSLGEGSGRLKFGAKYRYKDKTQDVTEQSFEWDGDDDFTLASVNGPLFTDRYDAGDFGPGTFPLPPRVTGNEFVEDFSDNFRDSLEEDEDAVIEGNREDFEATESTIAVYAMTELQLTRKLFLLPGLRYEYTALDSDGNVSVFEEELDDGDVETSLIGTAPASASNEYGYLFPMLHVRYRATPATNVRAAVTTALARPNFFELAPFEIRDDDELEVGNPDLDPSRSVNLDLMVEHYPSSIGVISGGVFYKQIQDPIISVVTELDRTVEGEVVSIDRFQSENGDSGFIWGVELAWQQQLRFLPGPFSGLGFYANYTYTDSEVELADGSKNVFPGQAEHVLNLALSWERRGFTSQISLNHTGEFLDEFAGDGVSTDRANDIFVQERWGLDFSASYTSAAQGVTVFVELLNLLNEPLELYQGSQRRPIQQEFYRPWGWIGAKYNL